MEPRTLKFCIRQTVPTTEVELTTDHKCNGQDGKFPTQARKMHPWDSRKWLACMCMVELLGIHHGYNSCQESSNDRTRTPHQHESPPAAALSRQSNQRQSTKKKTTATCRRSTPAEDKMTSFPPRHERCTRGTAEDDRLVCAQMRGPQKRATAVLHVVAQAGNGTRHKPHVCSNVAGMQEPRGECRNGEFVRRQGLRSKLTGAKPSQAQICSGRTRGEQVHKGTRLVMAQATRALRNTTVASSTPIAARVVTTTCKSPSAGIIECHMATVSSAIKMRRGLQLTVSSKTI